MSMFIYNFIYKCKKKTQKFIQKYKKLYCKYQKLLIYYLGKSKEKLSK